MGAVLGLVKGSLIGFSIHMNRSWAIHWGWCLHLSLFFGLVITFFCGERLVLVFGREKWEIDSSKDFEGNLLVRRSSHKVWKLDRLELNFGVFVGVKSLLALLIDSGVGFLILADFINNSNMDFLTVFIIRLKILLLDFLVHSTFDLRLRPWLFLRICFVNHKCERLSLSFAFPKVSFNQIIENGSLISYIRHLNNLLIQYPKYEHLHFYLWISLTQISRFEHNKWRCISAHPYGLTSLIQPLKHLSCLRLIQGQFLGGTLG